MAKIRITQVPVMETGGNVKKIRITGIPDNTPIAAYGGQMPGGYGPDLRMRTGSIDFPGTQSQVNPFAKVGNTLPEAVDGGNINAEKQEQVLGDFDQDGQQELMNVNGKPHTEGGKDINVPANSFVFSDTKDLKIKDPEVLAMFSMPTNKKGYTPAQIAKKYDLNKYKKILDNPQADEGAKKTAQLMNDNYMAKLNKLAMVQEQMKHSMGMPNSAVPGQSMQQQGQDFVQEEGNMDTGDQSPISQYGGNMYAGGGNIGRTDSVNRYDDVFDVNSYGNNFQPIVQPGSTFQIPYMNRYDDVFDVNNYGAGKGTANTPQAKKLAPYVRSQVTQQPTGQSIQPGIDANQPEWTWENGLPVNPNRTGSIPNMQPAGMQQFHMPVNDAVTPLTTERNLAVTDTGKGTGSGKEKGKGNKRAGLQTNPNFLGDALNLLQMAQLKKFTPFEPAPQAIIPSTVFMDPTRAIAAQQELAKTASESAHLSGNSKAARANAALYQGQAGSQAADVISQYANQNVGIANQANQQAAAITNELMSRQANRLAELNKANFLSDRDYQREMSKLQSEYVGRQQQQHDTNVKTTWLNKTSPYFDIDPVTQMPVLKSEDAKARYEKEVYGKQNGQQSNIGNYQAIYNQAKQAGMNDDDARDYAWNQIGAGDRKKVQHTDKATGDKVTTSGYTKKIGGYIPEYEIGGDFLALPSGPDMSMNMPTSMQQAPQYSNPAPVYSDKPVTQRKGDIATATNNPGNIIYTPKFGKLFGAVDSGIKQKDGTGHFALFPDLETGLKAQQVQLFGDTDGIMKSKYYKADTPVNEALNKWSNSGYGAEIYPEIAGKRLGDLTPKERDELTKRQIKRESGSMYKLLQSRGVFQNGGFALQKFIK